MLSGVHARDEDESARCEMNGECLRSRNVWVRVPVRVPVRVEVQVEVRVDVRVGVMGVLVEVWSGIGLGVGLWVDDQVAGACQDEEQTQRAGQHKGDRLRALAHTQHLEHLPRVRVWVWVSVSITVRVRIRVRIRLINV